jgi:hypothetical protein
MLLPKTSDLIGITQNPELSGLLRTVHNRLRQVKTPEYQPLK